MKHLFFSREKRRRLKKYREHFRWELACKINPRTGKPFAWENGRSMMSYYANASKSVRQNADLEARSCVLEDIRLSLLNGTPLKDFPKLGDKQ